MAFLNVEDLEGAIDVTILPDVYERTAPYLKTDMPILIKAEVNILNGNHKVKALEIVPLSQIREQYVCLVRIQVELSSCSKLFFNSLKTLLLNHPGNCILRLKILMNDPTSSLETVEIELPPNLRIQLSEDLVKSLEDLLGDRALIYELPDQHE